MRLQAVSEQERLQQQVLEAEALRSRFKLVQEEATQKESELMVALTTVQDQFTKLTDTHAETAKRLESASAAQSAIQEQLSSAESAQRRAPQA